MDAVSDCYVDSNILIYLIEGSEETRMAVRRAVEDQRRDGKLLTTSEIAMGECLIGAYRRRGAVVRAYEDLFSSGSVVLPRPVTRSIIEEAAVLGADRGLKLCDAVHVATAIAWKCTRFVTNDRRLRDIPGLTIVRPFDA